MNYLGRYTGHHVGRWLGALTVVQFAKLALAASFRAAATLAASFASAPIALRATFATVKQAVGSFVPGGGLSGGGVTRLDLKAEFATRKALAASHNVGAVLAGGFIGRVPLAATHEARAAVLGTFDTTTTLDGTAIEVKPITGTARGAL